jgi:hypothetical protein
MSQGKAQTSTWRAAGVILVGIVIGALFLEPVVAHVPHKRHLDRRYVNENQTAGGDLGGTFSNLQLQPGSVTGTEVQESTLGQVPSALLGGLGRTGTEDAVCDPDSTTFLSCASVTLNLPQATRVLVIGRTHTGAVTNSAQGQCALATNPGGTVPNTTVDNFVTDGDGFSDITLVGVTNVLSAGNTLFALDCNETETDIAYLESTVTAVAISPS